MKRVVHSLSTRLLFAQVTGFVIVISLGLVVLYFGIRAQMYDGIRAYGQAPLDMLVLLLKEEAHLLKDNPSLMQPNALAGNQGLNRAIVDFTARFPDIARLSVIDSRLRVLADSSGVPLGSITDQNALIEVMQNAADDVTRTLYYTSFGERYMRLSKAIHGSYDPLRASDVVGAVSIDWALSAHTRRFDAHFLQSAAVLICLLALQIGLQYLLLRKLALTPIRNLMTTVAQLEDGRLEARAPPDAPGEPGELGRTFNRMAAEIERTNKALQEYALRYRTIIESSPLALIELDSEKRVTMWNPAAQRLFGWSETEALNHPLRTIPPDKNQEMSAVFAALERGESLANLMTQRVRKDGSRVPVSVSTTPLRNATGKVTGFAAFILDISQITRAEEELRAVNDRLSLSVRRLEERTTELSLLGEMGQLLQACNTSPEAHRVIAQAIERLFPATAGSLYVVPPSRDQVEPVCDWGDEDTRAEVFAVDGCWALRRGRSHRVDDVTKDLICAHVTANGQAARPYLCVPMTAQGEALGLLHLQCGPAASAFTDEHQRLAEAIAEQIAMALSNLKLREALRQQSIQDVLTGLYNRRYMDATLSREIERARRHQVPVAVIMLDIDLFKHFNDTYGHRAGDLMLSALGRFLKTQIRLDDVACRYGGEEFTLILPGASQDLAQQRAEELRANAHVLAVDFDGQRLPAVTLSLGIAVFPVHGESGQAVLNAADAALYRAKENGRDRVEVALVAPPSG